MNQTAPPLRAARPCVRVLLIATSALALAAFPAAPQGASLEAVMRDTVLANGLQVVVVPNATVPLVTIQVAIRNGAFTQLTEADEGVPHLLEHMLFRSFGRSGFGSEAYKIQADYNGTTSDETVTYYITLPSRHLDRGVKLMADLMRSPRFEQAALDAEKLVVRGELERAASSPNYLLGAMVDQHLWGPSWGRKNAIGNMLTIRGATRARLTEMYRQFYVPNNASLVLAGDVSAADAFRLAAQHFSRWQRGADPFASLALPEMWTPKEHQQVTVNLEVEDVTLLVRWAGPSVGEGSRSSYAADLFATIINDPTSDFQERLLDTGLFQSVGMSYRPLAHVGPISIRALTMPDRLLDASMALNYAIARFSDPGYVTAEALRIAKKRRAVEWAEEMETPSGLAHFVGEMWSVAGIDYLRGYRTAIDSLQREDLESFVATYLANRPHVFGVMMSRATRTELGPTLGAAMAPWR